MMSNDLDELRLPMDVVELLRKAGVNTADQLVKLIELSAWSEIHGIDAHLQKQILEAIRRNSQQGERESSRWEPICEPPVLERLPLCVHRGDPLRVEFGGENGQVATSVQIVYGCRLHLECTESSSVARMSPRACSACADRCHPEIARLPPLSGPANLIWYVWPRRATRAVWEAQQERISRALHGFDGKKICAISVDDSTDADGVDRRLWDEVVQLPNDATQREVPGWRWLMDNISQEPGFTVWLHAKGVGRGAPQAHLRNWWELAYETLLDVETVRHSLKTHVIAGVFRRNTYARNLGVPWHFSGTFYAFRNDWVFQRDWQPKGTIDPGGWYAEAWPALIAPRDLTTCLRFEGSPSLYYASHWREQSCN